jgi:hypothetical protein
MPKIKIPVIDYSDMSSLPANLSDNLKELNLKINLS